MTSGPTWRLFLDAIALRPNNPPPAQCEEHLGDSTTLPDTYNLHIKPKECNYDLDHTQDTEDIHMTDKLPHPKLLQPTEAHTFQCAKLPQPTDVQI
jgi:hypothetical protein